MSSGGSKLTRANGAFLRVLAEMLSAKNLGTELPHGVNPT
jgi:hypothetical protein